MEHNSYNMQMIRSLLSGRKHGRKIAKELKANHMTINRKLNELVKLNVIDFNKEGKNKVYFLKDSVEAMIFKIMAEESYLLEVIKKYWRLRKIVETIRSNKEIKLAIIFGSYAKGTPSKNSDIDIFIFSSDKNIKKSIEKIDSKISVKLGNFEEENELTREIKKNHVIIKGFEEFYEK